MTSRVQEHRFTATATRPGNGTRPPGELWLNMPDYKLGMIDQAQAAIDLIAVRNYAATSTYASGDYVVHAGDLLKAKTALTPHAFLTADWDLLPTQALNDARYTTQAQNDARYYTKVQSDTNFYTKAYIDTNIYTKTQSDARYYTQAQSNALYLPLAGGSMTGELSVGATGIRYSGTGGYNHTTMFGWDGAQILAWVDGTYIGALATQSYTAAVAGNYLPLAGGTITGNLQVNGQTVILGRLQTNSARAIVYHPSTAPSVTWYLGSTGAMGFWYDGNMNFGGMDGNGNPASYLGRLMGNGSVEATNRTIGGQGMFANAAQDFGVFQSGQWRIMQYASSWGLWWDTSSGLLIYNTPSGIRWGVDWAGNVHQYGSLQTDGNLTCLNTIHANGDVTAGNNIRATNAVSADNGNTWMGAGGSGHLMQMSPGWYWEFSNGDGSLYWTSVQRGGSFWMMRSPDSLCANNFGPTGGNGAYVNFSDERAKTDIQPSDHGLDTVLKLNPIRFTRIANEKTEIGFSAQDVQKAIPEAVRVFGLELPDGSGGFHDENPTLGLSIDPIVAALVNATKELATRLAALETRP